MKLKNLCSKLNQVFRPKKELPTGNLELVTFPLKVIIRIARHTDLRTVCTLMRTCKVMRAIIHEEFFEHRKEDNSCFAFCSILRFSVKHIRKKYKDKRFENLILNEVYSKKKCLRKYAICDATVCSLKNFKVCKGKYRLGYCLKSIERYLPMSFHYLLQPAFYKFRIYGTKFFFVFSISGENLDLMHFNRRDCIETACFAIEKADACVSLEIFGFIGSCDFLLDYVEAIVVSYDDFQKTKVEFQWPEINDFY